MTISHKLPRQLFSSESHVGLLPSIHTKTESQMHKALEDIYEKHGILPDSPLGSLLKNGMIKLIIGMHHMHDAVNDLNDQLSADQKLTSQSTVRRLFFDAFTKACHPEKNEHIPRHIKERILMVEIGKSKVLSNMLYKIRDYTGQDLRSSFKILGSVVRASIDIYKEVGLVEFNFCKNPDAHRKELGLQLSSLRSRQANKLAA